MASRAALGGLALLLALAITLALPASAQASGVIYLPPYMDVDTVLEKTVIDNMAVTVNANSSYTIDLAQRITGIGRVDSVKVIVSRASGSATVKALDANRNVLAKADIVPLASGFTVTLPGNTAFISIENLVTSVWNGSITVVVMSSIDVRLTFQQTQVQVVGGQAVVPAVIEVYSLPQAGSVSLTDDRVDFEVSFEDPNDVDRDGRTVGDSFIYLQAYSGSTPKTYSVQVKITTSAAPGTYTLKITMWLSEGTQLEGDTGANAVAIGSVTLTASITDESSGTITMATRSVSGEWVKYALAGLAGIILGILFLGGRR